MPKVFIQGFGEVDLDQRSFLAAGGEGKIYAKGNVAYKVYDDPKKMMPMAKMKELAVLDHPHIIRPELLILDKKNIPIGYTMKLVKDTHALCQLFTKAFRQRNSITPDQMIKLVRTFQEMIAFVHSKHILVVDLNEMNFLADNTFKDLYAIDVNSYQTPHYPATVIMDSIRDRHCNSKFNEGTDWFSWGIVSFQMLIGIHPYKGKHPKFEHLAPDDRLNARMESNISVFDPDTSVPHVCQSFDVIPPALKQWYQAVFTQGHRVPPPQDYEVMGPIITKIKAIAGSNLFEIEELGEYMGAILNCQNSGGMRVVHTDQALYVNKQRFLSKRNDFKLGFTPKMNRAIAAYQEGSNVHIIDIVRQIEHTLPITSEGLMSSGGRIYIRNGTDILELAFAEMGDNFIPSLRPVGKVLDVLDATKVFDGVIFQCMMGRWIASIFPVSGECHQINLAELDDYRIIDAKYENNVLMVVGEKAGKYDRFVIRFGSGYTGHDMRKVENITYTGLNFTVADHGVCSCINEEEKMEVFSNKKDSATVKVIDDPVVDSDMTLFHDGSSILFSKGSKLYRISMKKKP